MTTALELPSTEEEIWRYSRINELDMSKFASGKLTTTVEGGEGVQLTGAAATALVGAGMHVQPDMFAQMNTDTPDVIALTNWQEQGAHANRGHYPFGRQVGRCCIPTFGH